MGRVARFWLPLFTTILLAVAAFGAPAASADTETVGLGGWQVQSTALVTQSAQQVSTPGFATGSWLQVGPMTPGPSAPRSARSSRPATARTCSSRRT